MKKILTPAIREDSVYYSDFTGKCFGKFEPDVTLTLQFNYGSKYDGTKIELDLSDKDCDIILNLIKNHLTSDAISKVLNLNIANE